MFDSIINHPFISYVFLLSIVIALLTAIFVRFIKQINPWVLFLPLGIPVISYILNYIIIGKTCDFNFGYTGLWSGFPSYHLFCRINKNILGWIGPISVIWLFISTIYTSIKWAVTNKKLHRLPMKKINLSDIVDESQNLYAIMKIKPPLLYLVNAETPILFTAGILKKQIFISTKTLEILEKDELKAALCHEFAHIARKDALINRAILLFHDLTLFSPASFWAYKYFKREEEKTCDAIVEKNTGFGLDLASALIKFSKFSPPSHPASFLYFFPNYNSISGRIKALGNLQKYNKQPNNVLVVTIFIFALALLLFIC